MSAKHTPGPWTVDPIQLGTVSAGNGWQVAQAQQIKSLALDPKQDERQANARLIAAAPDLLAALQALSNMYGSTWDRVDGALVMMDTGVQRFEAAHEQAMEAIAKATGKPD